MSSLFQGLVEPDGRVKVTTSATGTVPLRGLMVNPQGRVLVAADTGQARVHHSGRAFDPATGALLVDPVAVTEVLGMGGMTVDINGGVITKSVVPDVIHQGVGLTNEGYLTVDRGAPEGSVFYAPLTSDLGERAAGVPETYSRPLEALYEVTPDVWAIANPGIARFEVPGFLMEPAATNKVTNYNANPDAALTNLTLAGDAASVISRELEPQLLADSGLSAVCTSGYVQQISTIGASQNVNFMIHDGEVGNNNNHSWSGFARRVPGFEEFTRIRTANGQNVVVVPLGEPLLKRYAHIGSNTAANAEIALTCENLDGKSQCVLLGLVEETILSSPIITRGASASRGVDQLSYGNANSFFPQAQGMVLVDWSPKFMLAQIPAQHTIVGLRNLTSGLLYHDGANLLSTDGTNFSSVALPSFVDGDTLRLALLYGPTGSDALKVGFYHGGSWTWDAVARSYDGGFPSDDTLFVLPQVAYPANVKELIIYDENKGTAWVEANLTP